MKIVLQKVSKAAVQVDGECIGTIAKGYVLLFCVLQGDTAAHAQVLAEKIVQLRLFEGKDGRINDQSIRDIQGGILVISQFTLAGDVSKGNRPSYVQAASSHNAEELYEYFIRKLQELGVHTVETGTFGAEMQLEIHNDGPVTLLLEQ